jgi:hypothetical protein
MNLFLLILCLVLLCAGAILAVVVDRLVRRCQRLARQRDTWKSRANSTLPELNRLEADVRDLNACVTEWTLHAQGLEADLHHVERERDAALVSFHAAYDAFYHQAQQPDLEPRYPDAITGEHLIVNRTGSIFDEVLEDVGRPAEPEDLSITGSFTRADMMSVQKKVALAKKSRELEAAAKS